MIHLPVAMPASQNALRAADLAGRYAKVDRNVVVVCK
jgi:hypothetical protein